jgi:cytochrome b6
MKAVIRILSMLPTMRNLPYPLVLRRIATILAVAILTLTLVAGFTGVLLAFYYEPAAGRAYNSLREIATAVPNGELIRSLHDIAGNGLIITALLELVVMFLGRRFNASWLTAWISGILLTLTAIGLSWTAIILDWTQIGYWRFRIELGTIEAIPLIGDTLRSVLTGGGSVNTTTVAHLYTIHSYLLTLGAVTLAVIHLVSLIYASRPETELIDNTSGSDQPDANLPDSGALNS